MIEQVNLRSSFKEYKKVTPDFLLVGPYLRIVSGMFLFMLEKVLQGHDVEVGGGQSLGTLGVRGTKGGKPGTDWKSTYALWNKNPEARANNERIVFLNEHSSGVTYHYYWWTEGMKIGYKAVYCLKFTEGARDSLKNMVFGGQDYLTKVVKVKKQNNVKTTKGFILTD